MLKYFTLLRPRQWIKNLLLFFPPFFGGNIFSLQPELIFFPFLAFCAAASGGYIINDIKDIDADRNHKEKQFRSIAHGDISLAAAVFFALLLVLVAFISAVFVSHWFFFYLTVYFLNSVAYSFFLKHFVILDIFIISFGFLIRVLAGGEAFCVHVSDWLFMTVFLVSLFLAAGKRMGELVSMEGDAYRHRQSLARYTPAFLEGTLWFSAAAALVTYGLYTIEVEGGLFYTVPLAAFGLLRYIYIAMEGRGDPTEALLGDGSIMAVGIIWGLMIGFIVYR